MFVMGNKLLNSSLNQKKSQPHSKVKYQYEKNWVYSKSNRRNGW